MWYSPSFPPSSNRSYRGVLKGVQGYNTLMSQDTHHSLFGLFLVQPPRWAHVRPCVDFCDSHSSSCASLSGLQYVSRTNRQRFLERHGKRAGRESLFCLYYWPFAALCVIGPVPGIDIDLPEPEKVANAFGDNNLKVSYCERSMKATKRWIPAHHPKQGDGNIPRFLWSH